MSSSVKSTLLADSIVTGSMEMGRYVKYLAQKPFLPPKMKLREIFEFFEADYNAFVADFPQFAQYPSTTVSELSGGEVHIGCATGLEGARLTLNPPPPTGKCFPVVC